VFKTPLISVFLLFRKQEESLFQNVSCLAFSKSGKGEYGQKPSGFQKPQRITQTTVTYQVLTNSKKSSEKNLVNTCLFHRGGYF
jgi:hypothetical protein